MKFCSECAAKVTLNVPDNDNRPRFVCDQCRTIHYQNPKVVAGCIPIWQDKILLCKRAIEPRLGLWTLPAGFMENKETLTEGATRETVEEANANVAELTIYTVYSIPHISQIYVIFRANLIDLDFSAGPESLEVELFKEEEIPWDELAFPVIAKTLTHYYADKQSGQFGTHVGEIAPRKITD